MTRSDVFLAVAACCFVVAAGLLWGRVAAAVVLSVVAAVALVLAVVDSAIPIGPPVVLENVDDVA